MHAAVTNAMNKHTFVLCQDGGIKGWWLKVTSLKELVAYHDQHSSRWSRAFENIVSSDATGANAIAHGRNTDAIPLSEATLLYASNRGMSPIEAMVALSTNVMQRQSAALLDGKAVYINKRGGYCTEPPGKLVQFLHKDSFVFPQFSESDIRVSRFPGGNHWYAHVGSMEVRDGNTIKWDSYQEAYEHALSCVTKTTAKGGQAALW